MPLTFIDIERRKNWRIGVIFLFLLVLYLVIAVLFAATFLYAPWSAAPRFWVAAGLLSFLVAAIHFHFSAYDTVRTVVRTLSAEPPDQQDEVHRALLNIMEEFHVVTGNKRTIQCVVVPSFSMNALAAADLRGEAVIGITEGLLSRLSRPQLEAVIAHEAHHILSGDCLETTVAASLFGASASAIEKLGGVLRGRAFASPAFLLAWALLKLSRLLQMFISREREYRADAAAIRMTRNPLALAETLHLLSRNWRGAGFIGGGFEMLCIVNPEMAALDETEGFWADLLSTHPPLEKRIDVLLAMARVSVVELEAKAARRAGVQPRDAQAPRYFAMSPRQEWQGPFTLDELGALPWLSPLSWVTTGEQRLVERAWKEPGINAIFSARLSRQDRELSRYTCPACRQPLVMESFAGTQIHQCRSCAGTLVDSGKIPRIIARAGHGRPCPERIISLARAVVKENRLRHARRKFASGRQNAVPLLACPKCGNPMWRGFYSMAHLIELDRCSFCGLTWLDQDELWMLQCLIGSRIAPEPGGPDENGV